MARTIRGSEPRNIKAARKAERARREARKGTRR